MYRNYDYDVDLLIRNKPTTKEDVAMVVALLEEHKKNIEARDKTRQSIKDLKDLEDSQMLEVAKLTRAKIAEKTELPINEIHRIYKWLYSKNKGDYARRRKSDDQV